jgi:hypothetical protein
MPFVCGVVHHHPDSRLARAGWGWPLSLVEVRESEVHAYTPVLFGRWTLDVPLVEVNDAVLRRFRWGGTIRLRRTDGDVTVTTMGASYVKIADLLREKGIRVTADEGPAGKSG